MPSVRAVCFYFCSTNVVQLSNRNMYFYWLWCHHPLITQITIFMHQIFHWVLSYVFCQIIMTVSNFSLKTQMNESENALSENMLAQLLRSYDNNTVLFRDKVLWVGSGTVCPLSNCLVTEQCWAHANIFGAHCTGLSKHST